MFTHGNGWRRLGFSGPAGEMEAAETTPTTCWAIQGLSFSFVMLQQKKNRHPPRPCGAHLSRGRYHLIQQQSVSAVCSHRHSLLPGLPVSLHSCDPCHRQPITSSASSPERCGAAVCTVSGGEGLTGCDCSFPPKWKANANKQPLVSFEGRTSCQHTMTARLPSNTHRPSCPSTGITNLKLTEERQRRNHWARPSLMNVCLKS